MKRTKAEQDRSAARRAASRERSEAIIAANSDSNFSRTLCICGDQRVDHYRWTKVCNCGDCQRFQEQPTPTPKPVGHWIDPTAREYVFCVGRGYDNRVMIGEEVEADICSDCGADVTYAQDWEGEPS